MRTAAVAAAAQCGAKPAHAWMQSVSQPKTVRKDVQYNLALEI